MDENKLISKIGDLIDKKLKPVKDQLNTVELKVEAVNAKIDKSQNETIEVLTDLIQAGYEMHEQRIQKLEKHANLF